MLKQQFIIHFKRGTLELFLILLQIWCNWTQRNICNLGGLQTVVYIFTRDKKHLSGTTTAVTPEVWGCTALSICSLHPQDYRNLSPDERSAQGHQNVSPKVVLLFQPQSRISLMCRLFLEHEDAKIKAFFTSCYLMDTYSSCHRDVLRLPFIRSARLHLSQWEVHSVSLEMLH